MASDYYQLLRDPRWQRKRLEVMEAAKFRCANCDDATATLNVHHRFYKKGAKPWEYDSGDLVCLCEECHKQRHLHLDDLKLLAGHLDQCDLEKLNGYAIGLVLRDRTNLDNDELSVDLVLTPDYAIGLMTAYGIQGNVDVVLNEFTRTGIASHEFLAALVKLQHSSRAVV